MYEWWSTQIEVKDYEDGTIDKDFDPELAGAIDLFRRHLLIGIVNQHLGYLPSSLKAAEYSLQKDESSFKFFSREQNYDSNGLAYGNHWSDFLGDLKIFIPNNCDYEYLMNRSSKELSILVNGDVNLGFSGNISGVVPIDDPDLLDLLADFFGGLDGIFGLILATNPNISSDLRRELLTSDYYLTLPNTSTRELLETQE